MKRAVIFAHYDKDGLISDYVLYYLKELKKVSDEIIFVSCRNINEKDKLEVSHIIDEYHDEYDFGSYKRGFLYLQDRLDEFDEIVFANDSCYGPFYPLEKVFEKMANKDCDFWGITQNQFGIDNFHIKRPHVQSYFITFKKQIFTQNFFIDFIKSIKHEEDKKLIISKYEIGLTEFLVMHGFTYKTLIDCYQKINNISLVKWKELINEHDMPFVKKSIFDLKNNDFITIEGYEKYIKNYPLELIKIPKEIHKCIFGKRIKSFLLNRIAMLPAGKRENTVAFLNRHFRSIYKLFKD